MNTGPILQNGSTGAEVKRLQRILMMLKLLDYRGIDGIFSSNTENAVKDFQESKHLAKDGIVGPTTWAALPADPLTPLLQSGDTGDPVRRLQNGLHKYAANPGTVDGVFVPQTEQAVRTYQGQRGVPWTGVVRDLTWWVPAGAAGATLASLSDATTV